jgi:cyclopropane fatty-acyl-phospholipid synthase-like methyltransferase
MSEFHTSQNITYLSLFAFVIIVLIVLWYTYCFDIKKYFIMKLLGHIKNGSLTLINSKGEVIFQKNKKIKSYVENKYGMKNKYDATIKIYDEEKFFNSLADHGEIGLGESYTNKIWDVDDIYALTMLLVSNMHNLGKNPQLYDSYSSTDTDYDNVQHHYDVGNDFYNVFLTDKLHAYSCAFFLCPNDTLETAQYNKVNMVIRKMGAKKGDKILDIGCGWGAIANYVSQQTGSQVYGITLAKEQAKHITENYPNVRAIIQHYEHLDDRIKYDRVYSIGMLEHVRCSNYDTFFSKLWNILNVGGRCVVHAITSLQNNGSRNAGATKSFVTKHIFPGGQISKNEWVVDSIKNAGFKIVHIETLGGQHYAKTLRIWRTNLMNNVDLLKKRGYTDHLIRTYEYYFAICEALFWNDELQLTQFTFDKVQDLSFVTNSGLCPN